MVKKLIILLIVLLSLSVAGNLFFIIGGGIKINNTYHNEQYQYQNQSQAQIVVSLLMRELPNDWEIKEMTIDEIKDVMGNLSPIQSFFSKIIINEKGNKYILIYPLMSKDDKYKIVKP